MRVVTSSLIAALAMMASPITVSAIPDPEWRTLDTYNPNFKDPYSGQPWDALLDLDIQTSCVTNNLRVNVTIPTLSSKESNAQLVGAAFTGRVVTGITKHAPGNHGPAVATVDWDPVRHTLTFYNFVAGQATGPGTWNMVSPDPINHPELALPWINLNFDVPNTGFGNGPNQLPLTLARNNDPHVDDYSIYNFINLNDPEDFVAFDDGAPCGNNNGGGSGDPVFAGFQGQQFQFHGLPDEHFNLISSPDVQLNSHFVYLSSGKCDYNDTECFTHPGTYMDVLGLSVADAHIKLVAGTHEQGLRVWVNDMEVPRGTHIKQLTSNVTATMKYHHNGIVEINTELIGLEVINSDMFMNVRAALNNAQLLRVGAQKHTVTDHAICKTNTETHNHQLIESTVAKKYPVSTPLHGLIGQTWRNVLVCGRNWMGTVQDYMVSDLFASDNHYSYFKW